MYAAVGTRAHGLFFVFMLLAGLCRLLSARVLFFCGIFIVCSGDKALKRAPGCSSTKCRLQVYECDIIVYAYPVVVGAVLFDRIKAGDRGFDSVLIVLRVLLLKGLKRCFLACSVVLSI